MMALICSFKLPDAKIAEVELITKSYKGNATVPIDIAPTAQPVPPPSAPGTQENLLKAAAVAKHITQPTENDLCVQWYQPSLEEFASQIRVSIEEEGFHMATFKK